MMLESVLFGDNSDTHNREKGALYQIMKRIYSTDLAIERRRATEDIPGVTLKKEAGEIGEWERLTVKTEDGAREIGRPRGNYDTLNLGRIDPLDRMRIEDASDEVARELCRMVESVDVSPDRLLIVGLGNPELTPDSVGVATARLVEPTMQLKTLDEKLFYSLECSEIAVITPNVMSITGIETADIVCGVARAVRPDAVIVIDALAARSPKRLGTTIEFSNTGIQPASGVGMHQRSIDENLLRSPVITVGVPTVIDSSLFFEEEGIKKEGMLVSPGDIDSTVSTMAKIISGGINQAFGIFY